MLKRQPYNPPSLPQSLPSASRVPSRPGLLGPRKQLSQFQGDMDKFNLCCEIVGPGGGDH